MRLGYASTNKPTESVKLLKHENSTPDETREDRKTCEPIETSEINQIKLVTGIVTMTEVIKVIHSTFCEPLWCMVK